MPAKLNAVAIEYYYSEFYGRMVRDVAREIDWQRTHPDDLAGNLLCALALIVYTEVLGRIAIEQLEHRSAKNRDVFHAFLSRMGPAYDDWRLRWEKKHRQKVYDALRNGLAHEYVPKVGTKVWFFFEPDESFGLGEETTYPLVLKIRPYYEDFRKAAETLFRELRQASQ